jgi:L-fuculose-phosphate aldolase
MNESSRVLREAIVAVCRRLHARGLIAGAEGNVSVRLDEHEMLITPAGADKANIGSGQIIVAPVTAGIVAGTDRHTSQLRDASGDGQSRDSWGRASSEIRMHRACYAARPDVWAVVHAHPPVATGMATAGFGLPPNIVPELPSVVGPVALVPYGRPGTAALSDAMLPMLQTHEVFLLANHGVTAVGRNLEEALQRLESTEQAARIGLIARLMGGAQTLPASEVQALVALHPRFAAHLNQDGLV